MICGGSGWAGRSGNLPCTACFASSRLNQASHEAAGFCLFDGFSALRLWELSFLFELFLISTPKEARILLRTAFDGVLVVEGYPLYPFLPIGIVK